MHVLCLLDYTAKYEEASTTALSANPAVAVPLLTINGWIVMQRMVTGSAVSFNHNWAEYRDGFGSPTGNDNYWLGLDKVYRLVQLGNARLRVEVCLFCDSNVKTTRLHGGLLSFLTRLSSNITRRLLTMVLHEQQQFPCLPVDHL